MSTIEERIVSMKFQGDQFLAGIDKSLAKLEQFNQKLKSTEGTKGLDQIGAAAARQSGAFSKMAEGVQHISDRFKALGVIGMSALSNITNQAIFAGQNLAKSLSVGPIIDGFHEYETNLNSIQTILSNTQAAGTKLKDVTAALDELNHYSDQTIYNFSEMAKNIGTFTAAGVGLKPAVAAIKGIANLAALSGSNSQQASTAMYQLSQAISSGRVSLEDWNSVVNAGMGGTVFQRALAMNAEKIGTLSKGAVKLKGDMKNVSIEGKSFRESITAKPGEQSWLTSKVLTQTLAQFTGDLTDAQLAAEGFSKSEIKAIQSQARTAKAAATEVKTLSQLMGTLKESAGSGWAATWKTIFGDFPEAKTLFTNVNNSIGGFISASADARNKVLGDWKALGGRTAMINAISNSFKALVSFVRPIRDAFRQIFPATTGKQLADISKSIESFTKNLQIGGTTANNIKRTFAGFFAVLDIGWTIVKKIVGVVLDLVGVATDGAGGFLNFTGSIGDFLVGLDKAIKGGTGLNRIFSTITKVLSAPIRLIKALAGYLGSLFDGFNGSQAADNVAKFTDKLDPLGKIGSVLGVVWGHASVVFGNVWKSMQKVGDIAKTVFGGLIEKITGAMEGLDFKDLFAGINTGLFAALVLFIKKLTGSGGIGGIVENISEGFENLTGALGAMQNTLRAATLLQIAVAVGVLSLAMNTLSKIDAAGLTRASAAISVMFAQLLGSLLLFEKMSGFTGFAKMPFVAASMILLAVAVNVLASAMTKLATLDWNGLAKGLVGVTALLGALVAVGKLMPNPAGMITTAAGMVILAAAVKILVSAVEDLSGLSWEELGKGLLGVGAILGALGLFTKFSEASKGGLLQGAGLLLLAVGIKVLASAVEELSGLSWEEIAKGLTALAGALGILTAALILIPPTAPLGAAAVLITAMSLGMVGRSLEQLGNLEWGVIGKGLTAMLGTLAIITAALTVIPPTAPLGAAAILITAISMGAIADVLARLGAMDWGSIGKSLTALAGSLIIIAVGVNAMTGAMAGAAAMLVVAASLAILTPILLAFGQMSWEEMGKGLLMLAGAFAVLGVAGALLTPVVPTLIGLGIAVTLLGVGMLAAGAGVLAFSVGLTALSIAGAAGAAAVVGIVTALVSVIPKVVEAIGKGLVLFAMVIAKAGPAMTAAMTTVLTSLVNAIANNAPRIVNQLYKMLLQLVNTMAKYAGPLADAGARLIVNILNGVARNIGKIVKAATDVVVAFINAVSKNQGRVIDSGVKLIISFVNGLANSIRAHTGEMQAAGRNLAVAIIDGMTGGLASGVGRIASKAREVASSALAAAKNVLGIHSPSKEFEKIGKFVIAGFRKGLDGNKGQIDSAFNSLRGQLYNAMKGAGEDVDNLEKKLKKLKSARHRDNDEIRETTKALAQARKESKAFSAAYVEIKTKQVTQQRALDKLAGQYDALTTKIKAATDAYTNAVKTRDDYNASIRDQFSDAATPSGEQTAASYITDLQKQLEDTKTLANQLQQLRAMGLNDETYKDLLGAGTSALPFVTDLLAGGKDQINQINELGAELDSVGASMGKNASTALYQAAVDSAAGFLKGLQNQQAAIEKQMDKIADSMVRAIKKKLGIKSPSRVFAEVGRFSGEGLSIGLKSKANVVANSAASVGDKAVEAMRLSLSNVDKMVAGNIDLQPTIRPVLDLTDIQQNAGKIGSLIPTNNKMTVSGAYSNASYVAAAVRDRQNGDGEFGSGGGDAPVLAFTQNNYSPKAIGAVETYRNTKNQLSAVKGALST